MLHISFTLSPGFSLVCHQWEGSQEHMAKWFESPAVCHMWYTPQPLAWNPGRINCTIIALCFKALLNQGPFSFLNSSFLLKEPVVTSLHFGKINAKSNQAISGRSALCLLMPYLALHYLHHHASCNTFKINSKKRLGLMQYTSGRSEWKEHGKLLCSLRHDTIFVIFGFYFSCLLQAAAYSRPKLTVGCHR